MLFLLDETLDIRPQPLPNHRYEIKPVRIGRKYKSLKDALEEINPGWRAKKLSPKPYRLSEELEFFSRAARDEEEIVYFYEPRYSSVGILSRIRNWLLPETHLIHIPIYGNLAEIVYLIEAIRHWCERRNSSDGQQELSVYIKKLQGRLKRWILSPMPMAVHQWKKRHTVYKPLNKKPFLLVEVTQQQKIDLRESGELTRLWGSLSDHVPERHRLWAVCKGVTEDLPEGARQRHIKEPVLPVNVPFVEAVTGPRFDTILMEEQT